MLRVFSVALLTLLTLPNWAEAKTNVANELHRLTVIEDHRDHEDPYLVQALRSRDPRIVEKALVTVGRIGHPDLLDEVLSLLTDRRANIRATAAFAAGLIGGVEAESALLERLQHERRRLVKRELLMALGRVGSEGTVATIADALWSRSLMVRASAAQALGILFNKPESSEWSVAVEVEERLLALAPGWGDVALSAAFALSRYRTPVGSLSEADYLDAIARARNPKAHALLWRRASQYQSDAVVDALAANVTDAGYEGVRVEAARALARQACNPATLAIARAAFVDPANQVVVAALQSVSGWGACGRELTGELEAMLNGDSPWFAAAALSALLAVLPAEEAGPMAMSQLDHAFSSVASVAVSRLPSYAGDEYVRQLVELANGDDARRGPAMQAIAGLDPARATADVEQAVAAALADSDYVRVYFATLSAQRFEYAGLVPAMERAYRRGWLEDEYAAKIGLLQALGALGDADVIDIIELGLADGNPEVISAANEAHQAIFGQPAVDEIPLNQQVEGETPSRRALDRAVRTRVLVETTKGAFVLKMLRAGELTAHNFVSLVEDGFYDGLTFHRIVPNFVAQGGDPRGDGWGGTGTFIRDEASRLRHLRGTVGIATSGKDTGSGQWFINHAPNLHLDGRYTIFARVVDGMDVVDTLEESDQILRARVLH